jgi:hypothetical protein
VRAYITRTSGVHHLLSLTANVSTKPSIMNPFVFRKWSKVENLLLTKRASVLMLSALLNVDAESIPIVDKSHALKTLFVTSSLLRRQEVMLFESFSEVVIETKELVD